jgi:hypothetical protein
VSAPYPDPVPDYCPKCGDDWNDAESNGCMVRWRPYVPLKTILFVVVREAEPEHLSVHCYACQADIRVPCADSEKTGRR